MLITGFELYQYDTASTPDKSNMNKTIEMLGHFIENQGQIVNDEVIFIYSNSPVYFLMDKIVISLDDGYANQMINITFPSSNHVKPIGEKTLDYRSNYIYTNKQENWHTDVNNYQQIKYPNLYNGIDLIYYSSDSGLKYDWMVHPGANPNDIQIQYHNIESLSIDNAGSLVIQTMHTKMLLNEKAPRCFQNDREVRCDHQMTDMDGITYRIGDYNPTETLIIDPLLFSTYLGGPSINYGNGIDIDNDGNVYVTGRAQDKGWPEKFPTHGGAYDKHSDRDGDVFVTKFNSEGTKIIYSTFVGGTRQDDGISIQVDENGYATVTGTTSSLDFPTTPGAYNRTTGTSFVFKLNERGSELISSTYIATVFVRDFTTDIEGNYYFTGKVNKGNLPTTDGAIDSSYNGEYDTFICKISWNMTTMLYATYIGGAKHDYGNGIAVDKDFNAYVVGHTYSKEFPTTEGAYDTSHDRKNDAYLIKINYNATSVIFSTYIGGDMGDTAWDIEIDEFGNSYITGNTASANFPTTDNANDTTHDGSHDVFVTKINSDGNKLILSTLLGGIGWDQADDISLDEKQNIYISGWSNSTDFPTTPKSYDETLNGKSYDIFLAKYNNNVTNLLYSTLIGGSNSDKSYDMVLVGDDTVCTIGVTGSLDFPTTKGAYTTSYKGKEDTTTAITITKLHMIPEERMDEDDDQDSPLVLIFLLITALIVVVIGIILYRCKPYSYIPGPSKPLTSDSQQIKPVSSNKTVPPPPPSHSQETVIPEHLTPHSNVSTAIIECPGCHARMEIEKLGYLQQIQCESCGQNGEIDI